MLALVAALLLAGGCERSEPAPAVDLGEEDFIEAYVELRIAAGRAESAAEFEAQREQILARYGTSREEMLEFIDAHAHDVSYMATLWDSIQARLQASEPTPPSPSGPRPPADS